MNACLVKRGDIMPNSMEEAIITLNAEIKELINVVKDIQIKQEELQQMSKKHHAVVMKRFSNMQEFHEIADMTNQVFEKRLGNIEKAIYKVKNS